MLTGGASQSVNELGWVDRVKRTTIYGRSFSFRLISSPISKTKRSSSEESFRGRFSF